MKITNKLMKWALCIAFLAALGLVGCEKTDIYSIDSPADLQSKIDSIATAKANIDTGDTTYIDIATAIVGPEDNSAGWWSAFSDYFTIPTNKLLHLEFVNHNGGSANNWNNWNLAITNEVADRDGEGYKEYFVLRSDAFGWGGGMGDEGYVYDGNMISQNYPDTDGDGDIWNDFRTTMDGATVTLDIDHSATGNVYVTATAVGTNGTELVQTYQQPVSATADIVAFLICDASYFEMQNAYLIPSKVTVVEDVDPVSITIENSPSFVEIGDEDFWGDAIATVTFADGSSEQVDTADIAFSVIPDMTTLGEKTVIVAYNKTKQGEFCEAVTTLYTLEVTNSVSSLEVTTLPLISTYYFFSADPILFNPTGIEVTATYSDGTTGVLETESLQFGSITAAAGSQTAEVSYTGATSTVTTTCPLTLVQGVSQVGANDFSTPWATYSEEYPVASGSSTTISMYCYSDNAANWHTPCLVVGNAGNMNVDVAAADGADAVVRMDSWGWGDGYATATATSDWNWEAFASNISGSQIVITVTNNGDNTANIRYDVTYATGETHFQLYEGVTVDSADLSCALAIEGAYVVIVE
ncbi:hypothetical protein [Plebeiibacterium marinum]|uniref:Ig-like domain-containing protein n=1 Tax=Plebeiibacterium marinum TaxID=2992111 RepID=A0AAE3MCN3_9BACT|nr:hypothetical protein [Plebeiobacterium marinum]MCW3805333.1 hypothetical protein [Plebeiobacterium marinum]